jgi:hypothetical protein
MLRLTGPGIRGGSSAAGYSFFSTSLPKGEVFLIMALSLQGVVEFTSDTLFSMR